MQSGEHVSACVGSGILPGEDVTQIPYRVRKRVVVLAENTRPCGLDGWAGKPVPKPGASH